MRVAWMAATVGGLAAAASGQSNFTFQSVFENQVTDGAGTADITGLYQVALFDGDRVATLSAVGGLQDDAVVYSAPGSLGWDSNVLVKRGDSLWDGASGAFNFLHNVSISGDGAGGARVHFVARADGSNFGLFQYTAASGAKDGLFEGQPYAPAEPFSYDALGNYVSYQVNGQGQAVLAGKASGSGQDVLLRMSGASVETMADTAPPSTLSFAHQSRKRVITPAGKTVVAVQDLSPGADPEWDVVSVSSPGGPIASVLPASFFSVYEVEHVYAAADTPLNGTRAIVGARNKLDNTYATVATDGNAYTPLSTYAGGVESVERLHPEAVLTGNGKAAFYTPDPDNDVSPDHDTGTLHYVDLAGAATLTPVAQVGMSLGDGWILRDLTAVPTQPMAPMLNENGVIVFDARIGNESGDDDFNSNNWKTALLAWTPTDGLQIVAREGGSIEIDGVDFIIQQFFLNNTLNPLSDGGVYKDGLNDQNRLAFGVMYGETFDSEEFGVGVVITTIPEPRALAVAGFALAGLSLRRRRLT